MTVAENESISVHWSLQSDRLTNGHIPSLRAFRPTAFRPTWNDGFSHDTQSLFLIVGTRFRPRNIELLPERALAPGVTGLTFGPSLDCNSVPGIFLKLKELLL